MDAKEVKEMLEKLRVPIAPLGVALLIFIIVYYLITRRAPLSSLSVMAPFIAAFFGSFLTEYYDTRSLKDSLYVGCITEILVFIVVLVVLVLAGIVFAVTFAPMYLRIAAGG